MILYLIQSDFPCEKLDQLSCPFFVSNVLVVEEFQDAPTVQAFSEYIT